MVIKFEGFEGCFRMTLYSTDGPSLILIRETNSNRKELDVKIAKGTATRLDMMNQLKSELKLFDHFLKTIDNKKKARQCCAVANNVISTLIKRINNMWNTIFLLFAINNDLEPEALEVKKNIMMSSCTNCCCCNITVNSILSSIEMVSLPDDTIFNLASYDFIKILQTTAFVDKTLMIKEVFQNEEIKGIVITAPRKYGKSTNLTMLKYFLEIQVDSLGKLLTKANAEEPITDTSNYELFKGLKISKEVNIMNKHLGKYPVLYANFNIDMKIRSYYSVVQGCKEIIHKSFQLHNYLQKSSKLSIKQRQLCQSWCDNKYYKMINDIDDISIGLRLLCTLLTKHYNKPCFVLIDEIDFFTKTVTITETLLKDYKTIVLFMNSLLLFLINNQLVVKSFVTGKSGYAIHCIVPSCMKIQSFYKFHKFTDYFGLTEKELKYLFKKSEFKNVSTTINEVKAYYGSYLKIEELTKIQKNIYCLWSILNVLKCKRIDNYWRDFGNFFCSFSNPTIKNIIDQMLNNDLTVVVLFNNYEYKTDPTTPHIIQRSETPSKSAIENFFNLLLDIGYLTCNSSTTLISELKNINCCLGKVKIPNQEVRNDILNKMSLLS